MITTLLIANRGEIACRVIKTARRLGIRTVAVYSDADASARHVALADEAHRIGPPPARESYLVGDRILEVAKASRADAIHPGYGFLSENAAFAEACAVAGVTFVGPPADAIRAMGGKSEAKALMAKAGVPLVPGYHGDDQDDALLATKANEIGFPALIKASAGGGGKGMRVVETAGDFAEALAGARREASNSFGDDRVLIEKYLERPRHVEIQVFADTHGDGVYLFERDCSIQRRHQKVVEEAPAPGMDPDLRRRMGDAAVQAAKAIGYVGAGTVEFLLDQDGAFYFMEMNTRLQVEHPVTEMITGQDLVAWQLSVAAGAPLPVAQEDLTIDGHAIEVRLYAEDPGRAFLPQTGYLDVLRFPPEGPHLRIDTGVVEGDVITIHYDPMIAKLIVWDCDRSSAIRRLTGALSACRIAGLVTNLDFLQAIACHPAFASAELDTRFIERHAADLLPGNKTADDRVIALASLGVLECRASDARLAAASSSDPHSPWAASDGWRLNDIAHDTLHFHDGEDDLVVPLTYGRDGYRLDLPGGAMTVHGDLADDGTLTAVLGEVRLLATVSWRGDRMTVMTHGERHVLGVVDPLGAGDDEESGTGRLTAPMPGKVIAVHAANGASVTKGTPLVVLEAMKMEHTLVAPADGMIEALNCTVGDQVHEGMELVRLVAHLR